MGRAIPAADAGGADRDPHSQPGRRRAGDRGAMSKQPWALVLGASSGFGEATAVELARAGMNIWGVHMDRRDKLPQAETVQERVRALGRECEFSNFNAADEEKRKDCVEQIRLRLE